MNRKCDSSQPTLTSLPCEAKKAQVKCHSKKPQTKSGRRAKGYRTLHLMAGPTDARAITSDDKRGKRGQRKGKTETMQKKQQQHYAKALGSKAKESKTSRAKPQAVAKTYQNALRRKPNSRARNGPRASPCGADVETRRRISKKIPPGKLNQTPRTKANVPRRKRNQNRENRIKILEGSDFLNVN